MNAPAPILERAYQLARSGTCRGITELKTQLAAEGYTSVNSQLYGKSLNDDLRRLCRESAGE